MGNAPYLLVGWMVVAMFVVGAGLTFEWSLWVGVLLGIALLGVAYRNTQKGWIQTRDEEAKIRASLVELQQITDSPQRRSSLPSSPELLSSELEQMVKHIQKRIGNLEEERAKISSIVQN